MRFALGSFVYLLTTLSTLAAANSAASNLHEAYANGKKVWSITPIFSELVRFALPEGFHTVFEHTHGPQYIQEMVPEGETTERWTQMITLTGYQDLGDNTEMTPEGFAGAIAGGFKKSCPETFAALGLMPIQTNGYQPRKGFAAVSSCGAVNGVHSETALLAVIKGTAEYYTIQWAERGPAVTQPLALDKDKWMKRLALLKPIFICERISGESPPYSSCMEQK